MSETERALARCKVYNEALTKYVVSLIETTRLKGAPNAATLIAACEHALRDSFAQAEQASRWAKLGAQPSNEATP